MYKLTYPKKLKFFLSEFDTLLMYINLHTRSHFFLKIRTFCKKIITFSSSPHLMKKVNISPKISILFAQNWFFCTKIDIDRHTCNFASKFTRHYFITGLRNSLICPKTDDFCIKMLFFTKRKQRHQKLTLSKTEDISLRKLNISIKNWHFWKWWPFATKMEKSFKIGVSARFSILSVKLTKRKNWHF